MQPTKIKEFDEIQPYLLDGYLIISLHPDWVNKFGKIPTFIAMIDGDGKLHIISKEKVRTNG